MQSQVTIVAGVRTPFARAGGEFRDLDAVHLGTHVVSELLQRTGLDPEAVDEVILGNIAQPAEATNVARVVALRAGIPADRPAYTVQRNCASGMQAITSAAEKILTGSAQVVIAGGTESMSRIPLLFPQEMSDWMTSMLRARSAGQKLGVATRFRPRFLKPRIALEMGLTDGHAGINMGQTAEVLAREFGIRRAEQDQWAYTSHKRAVAARERLRDEIAPLPTSSFTRWSDTDSGPREDISLERLGTMRPYFDRKCGTVTVGNACPITDGAAAVLVMHRDRARALGYEPLGTLRGWAYAGLEPERMGLGPAYSTARALANTGLTVRDLDLIELNEAFAAQVLANLRAFERGVQAAPGRLPLPALGALDPEHLNVNGGAIALGHPVGASGARLVLTLLHEMRRRDAGLGLATLCIGGGQGAALVFERNGKG
jgi:acetyl-CoA C-acetyltransferase/acetyl-CoA acyltransferase